MKNISRYISIGVFSIALFLLSFSRGRAIVSPVKINSAISTSGNAYLLPDTNKPDTTPMPYPFPDQSGDGQPLYNPSGGLMLDNPSNIHTDVEYNPETGQYDITQKIGDMNYRPPTEMDSDQFEDYEFNKAMKNYWKQRTHAESMSNEHAIIPKLHVGGELFNRIFGGNTVDIRPQGTAELIFGSNTSKTDNPALPVKQRKISTFNFNEKIQLNVIGKIGDKLKLTTNYNTEATFDFQNQMKLEYTGHEDEIIKKIEAGNVSMPLPGSLISGSQSLFGIKTKLQFGRLTATTIFSQKKGKTSEVNVKGGAQTSSFTIKADNYEANKHYFLSQYFRDHYDEALANLPVINSGINVTKVEVWVTNKTSSTDNTRNIVAFADLGEENSSNLTSPSLVTTNGKSLPQNAANSLDPSTFAAAHPGVRDVNNALTTLTNMGYTAVTDFEKVDNARLLAPSEYTFNPKLGFISLNQALNYDEVLGVAYQYTYMGQTYQVGEFSTDGVSGSNELMVKMLKSTNVSPKVPMWKLMMKNVYSIGAYQVNAKNFKLDVLYNNPATGVDANYIPEGDIKGQPLIHVLGLDNLNAQMDKSPDGVFDFLDGVTIDAANGRIYFPVLQPFGADLRSKFSNQTIANKYVFQQLYDSTLTAAQQFPDLDRYTLKGTYQSSSSSDISLNAMNIPQGSVTVTAGGVKLTENVDYTVDYTLGKVKIINQGILNSGTPIKISLESNSLFSIQSKTLMGTHLNYRISKNFNIGATVMNLTEKPLTQKVNIGDEPISNTIWGFNGDYKTEAPFLTRWIDKLPLIGTKAASNITATGEFAQLIPGHPKAIGKTGTSYIDDFEGSETTIDISSPSAWSIASTPQGQPSMFPEAALNDSLPYGFNRAKIAWYVIDPLFLQHTANLTPPNVDNNAARSNNFTRQVLETEIFPNKQSQTGQPVNLPVLNLAFYPSERGPYNYDADGDPGISAGVDSLGNLKDPTTRWGGIMRPVETNDFEAANISYIEFWMMDPYNQDNTDPNTTGSMYVDLGNVSEDVLRDGRKSFENGLPTTASGTDYMVTAWGHVPSLVTALTDAFDNNQDSRPYQDVGLDGLSDDQERTFFQSSFLDKIAQKYGTNSPAYQDAYKDPSSDDYHYYRGDDYDAAGVSILDRYKKYNGMDGNSPTESQYYSQNAGHYPTSATTTPNTEDINHDNTMSQDESYYQYQVKLDPQDVQPSNVGSDYITDVFQTHVTTADGRSRPITWYQFKIPIKDYNKKVGSIQDFKSIRFIRIFLRGFDKPIICRFAKLEFVRDEWRKYDYSIQSPGEYIANDDDQTSFNLSAVNLEENGSRTPVNYVMPPGIQRQTNVGTANLVQMNEQAMSERVCNLQDGSSRAAYKNVNLDVRSYKRLQMFVHCESGDPTAPLHNGDVTAFIRLGSDYTSNYYEYEVPLQVTPPGSYNGNNSDDQYKVWPEANNMNIAFSVLQQVKQDRDMAMLTNPNVTLQTPYTIYDGNNKVTIVGNPNLSEIQTIMLGVRNPKQTSGNSSEDDGLPKCAEVWFNELRLTDFNEQGGWATIGRVTTTLADLGTMTIAGNYSTPGFGGIETKINDRSKEWVKGYDISSNLQLGKFFPDKLNVNIPMYVGYSRTIKTPQYDPLESDILMKNALNNPGLTPKQKTDLKNETEDFTQRKSLNFTNVKKNRSKGAKRPHIYDISNFSATYAYTEQDQHNINEKYNNQKTYHGELAYDYTAQPKIIKPFSSIKFLRHKYFALVRDFNFYPMPNKLQVTADIDRQFAEQLNRDITGTDIYITPTINKNFTMKRTYNMGYNITRSLKLNYTATNDARVMEPQGRIDTQQKKDSVLQSIETFGRNTHFRQSVNATYNLPINKIPLLDFVSASVRYGGSYDWMRAPFSADSLGNTIQNSNTKQLNGQFNMVTLYNKIPFLKKINQQAAHHRPKGWVMPHSKVQPTKNDSTKNKKKKQNNNNFEIFNYVARVLMSVKNVGFTYSDNRGTLLPGYIDSTQVFGVDTKNNLAPGLPFVFGSQRSFNNQVSFDSLVKKNDWIVKNPYVNTPHTTTHTKNLSIRASAEPLPGLKIDLTANRNWSQNSSDFFIWDPAQNKYVQNSRMVTGSFSMSFLSFKTAFVKNNKTDNSSTTYDKFLGYTATISARMHEADKNHSTFKRGDGYWDGYGPTSQQVLIPSFMAAYGGISPNHVTLSTFPAIPKPNWRITYNGLTKIPFVKKYFESVTVSHAYNSVYTVGNYTTNLNFVGDSLGDGFTYVRNDTGNLVAPNIINSISISEQFNPLVKVEMTWKNRVTTNLEIKKDRTLTLGLVSNNLTEVDGQEYVVGSGYRLKNIKLPFKIGRRTIKSDLNLEADLSIRNNESIVRSQNFVNGIPIEQNIITSGQRIISIKTSAEYMISQRLSLKLFFNKIINKPATSITYPTSNTNAGLSLRFTLS